MSDMPSDPSVQQYPNVPMQEMQQPPAGRTIWNAVSSKWLLILVDILVIAVVTLVIVNVDGFVWQGILAFLSENWYVALGPIVGWILGIYFAKLVHQPDFRVVISLDPERHTVQALMIPEGLFRYLNQSGNNVLYHSPGGNPVYLANRVDLVQGMIDYGWVHEHDAIMVFTKEKVYNEWHDTLARVMEDNLKMMDIPEVYGLQFAGEALKKHLDRAANAVGVSTGSSGGPSDYHEAKAAPDEGGEKEMTDDSGQ